MNVDKFQEFYNNLSNIEVKISYINEINNNLLKINCNLI